MEQAIEIVTEAVALIEEAKEAALGAARAQVIELAPGDLDKVGGGIVGLYI